MRSKNTFRNLAVSLLYEVFILLLGLIVPRFIILSYGDSINGLTQTINRLLTLVNLLQAGAVGASIYEMLKPVAENNYEIQSAIMYSSKKYFYKIGVIYLSIVFVCAIFFGFYLHDDNLTVIEIILSFCVLAVNGSLYFFFTSKYDIIFSSYQKKYLLTLGSFIERMVYYLLLFLVITGDLYFIFMYVALLCGGVVRVSINSFFYRKLITGKIVKNPKNKNYKIKDRKYLMLASIGDQTISAAPTVIVTMVVNLNAASVFSVYSMVYISMKTLLNSFHHSISAIFGNLVASAQNTLIARVFDGLFYVFAMLGTLLSSCCAFLFMKFIDLYCVGFNGQSYIQPILACFIVAYIAIFAIKSVITILSNSYGLFKINCKTTLICGFVSLVLCIIITVLFGMQYVMVGVLFYHISTLCVFIYVMRKRIDWFKLNFKWILRAIVLISFPILSWNAHNYFLFDVNSWVGWIILGIIFACVIAMCLLIYTLIFERNVFLMLIKYLKLIFSSSKKKKIREE